MKINNKNYLICIVGPTAIGKTAMAIKLAQHYGCEIVSCDSRQFYKEMTIGTAVPSKEELEAVKHHFIQNKSINDDYSVGDYEREVLPLFEQLFQKNNVQILVGGSGLYVDAVWKGLDRFPAVSDEIKNQIEQLYENNGIEALQHLLKEKDPIYYQTLLESNPQTLQNPQRIKRFISVCLTEGLPYSSYINNEDKKRNFHPIFIGLQADRESMYQRINKRVDIMIQNGLLNEAFQLFPLKHLNALQTVGYRELFTFFEGLYSLDLAIEEIKKNTRRFAKRQMTWFNKTPNVKWFDFQTSEKDILQYINQIITYGREK